MITDAELKREKSELFEEARRWWDACGKEILRQNRERLKSD